jgi:hypothetical protein
VVGDPTDGRVAATAVGTDAYVVSLDADLKPEWLFTVSGPGTQTFEGLAAGPNGMIAAVGTGESDITIVGEEVFHAHGKDMIAVVLDATGLLQWHHFWGGALDDRARGIAFASSEVIVVGGEFSGTLTLPHFQAQSNGKRDVFVTQFAIHQPL